MDQPSGPAAPAGWYPDPADAALDVYWDGTRWTDARRPRYLPATAPTYPGPSTTSTADSSGWSTGRKAALASVLGVILVSLVVGAATLGIEALSADGKPSMTQTDQSAQAACDDLVEEVMGIEVNDGPTLVKVRQPIVDEDHRDDYDLPSGTDEELVLSCTGAGVLSDGTTRDIVMEATVDSDGDPFVSWQQAPLELDADQMQADLLAEVGDRADEFGLTPAQVETLTADCSSVTDDKADAYYACTLDDGTSPVEIPVTLNPDGTYVFVF